LVTPESVVIKALARFINEKRTIRQLDRIVIDKCHVVLDSIHNPKTLLRLEDLNFGEARANPNEP